MLSLQHVRRFCKSAAVIASNKLPAVTSKRIQSPKPLEGKPLEQPALVKLKAERDPEKLFQLFKANAHNRLVIENRFAFEDTVSRLAGAQRFDYIEHLLEHQKTLPQGRREGFIVRIIMLYAKAGMTKHAIDTFYDMHLYRCKRTVKSFNAALKVLTQTRNLEAIQAFLTEVPEKFDLQLDIFSINIVVKAFCEMDIVDKAYLIMVNAEKWGIKPDVVTYTTLLSALYKSKRCEIGNGLWNLMRLGIRPDEVTCNLVIKGFGQAGYLEMAKRVYSSMHTKGCKVNEKIYQTMIHYLCKGGEFNLACTMCKDCMKRNWYPSVDTILALLEGLKKNKQLGKAKMIVALVQKRVPPFPSKQLSSMQSILSKS
ncbi:hypothetical protein LWI28_006510 [Acer negundo]|uniref:Pentatricopeptide repeat-containing protein n=1 Tax=Acer negundo TaxID=4023 RepID=A0AAD5JG75_ACENE|nr:hypothetical protein LWI28_006510 [Acer negundo]KAK4858507.1 hypothetical protein QYF36_017456 [Acer negundo]